MITACKQTSKTSVTVYDDNGRILFTRQGTLVGYTAETVSLKNGSRIYVYDIKGRLKFAR